MGLEKSIRLPTGREYDGETGLYFYRARYYDPTVGRFISRDPIGLAGGINQYAYVHNNPINYIDPDGLSLITPDTPNSFPRFYGGGSLSDTGNLPARGGTYVLRDPVSSNVVRTGRSCDLSRRATQHARDPVLKDYTFEPVHRTNNYSEQRGLENMLHNQYNPPLNLIRPISPQNPNMQNYLNAAERFLLTL